MSGRREITPVAVPHLWAMSGVVERLEDTRWYVERGSTQALRQWLKEIHDTMAKRAGGLLVPLQWVPVVVGVSREAVNKRAKSGGLTVFSFIVEEHQRTILGGTRKRDSRQRYDLVPYSECEQWRDLLWELRDALAE